MTQFPAVRRRDGTPYDYTITIHELPPFPSDTPYGNLLLKGFKIDLRLAHVNDRLAECATSWSILRESPLNAALTRYTHTGEEAVHHLRRIADEYIAIWDVLGLHGAHGGFADRVSVDSIGAVLRLPESPFLQHRWLLETLNDISNAHKHSILQTDINAVALFEPCVIALTLPRNRLGSESRFYNVSLRDLAEAFTAFLRDVELGGPFTSAQELPGSP